MDATDTCADGSPGDSDARHDDGGTGAAVISQTTRGAKRPRERIVDIAIGDVCELHAVRVWRRQPADCRNGLVAGTTDGSSVQAPPPHDHDGPMTPVDTCVLPLWMHPDAMDAVLKVMAAHTYHLLTLRQQSASWLACSPLLRPSSGPLIGLLQQCRNLTDLQLYVSGNGVDEHRVAHALKAAASANAPLARVAFVSTDDAHVQTEPKWIDATTVLEAVRPFAGT